MTNPRIDAAIPILVNGISGNTPPDLALRWALHLLTNPKEQPMTDETRDARWEGASDDEKAFVHFLYALTGCKTVEEIAASAGALLQDLGYEPKEPS